MSVHIHSVFFLMPAESSAMWRYHGLFTPSPGEGYLDCLSIEGAAVIICTPTFVCGSQEFHGIDSLKWSCCQPPFFKAL